MITSKPVSEARANRGSGIKHLGGLGEGKCNPSRGGSYVFDDKRKEWVNIDDAVTVRDTAKLGDYDLGRDIHRTVEDYCRFKDKRDRAKIDNEFFGKQEDRRRKLIKEGTLTQKIMEANNG